jgi:hypothetical protein
MMILLYVEQELSAELRAAVQASAFHGNREQTGGTGGS